MKQVDLYVFSATGNTAKCAQLLKTSLIALDTQAQIKRIENGQEKVEQVGDTVVICYPVHGFNAPQNVIDFCRNLPQAQADAYVLKTSGEPLTVNDNSSKMVVKALESKGYAFKGEYHYVMPYNMIFRHTDEMAAKMWETAQKRIPQAAETIAHGETHLKKVPLKAKFVRKVVAIEHWGARFNGHFFRVKKDKCIQCMQCVRNCPTHNITYQDGKFKFGGNCLLCTRCSFNCPTDAFRIGLMDFMRVNGKYNFKADSSQATIGRYCHKSYVKYFSEE